MSLRLTVVVLLLLIAGNSVAGQSADGVARLPDFAVSADRRQPVTAERAAGRWVEAAVMQRSVAVDRALRTDPAFSLFRRSDSLAANPTAQGVSLRGLGPSGASRSLVLLDGVPLNDSFGGWVPWTQVPVLALAGAEIRPGGGSAAWGNAAFGGVIALVTRPPVERDDVWRASVGSLATHSVELAAGAARAEAALRADLRWFDTDGFHPLRADARGPVDRPLAGTHRSAGVVAARRLGAVEARLTLRHFEEERVNGTAAQRNATRIDSAALALAGTLPNGFWHVTAYAQDQTFRSFFSAVNAARTIETPANDQFAVPTEAAGASATFAWAQAGVDWIAGADARAVRGETREDFLFDGTTLTRRRIAGGEQSYGGAFVGAGGAWAQDWRLDARLRADHWALTDGRRREWDRATGASVRDERFADRRDVAWSGQIETAWRVTPAWTARGAAYSAFRVPTLNELYRPFRVGNTNTEANPRLAPETLRGAELGLAYRRDRLEATLTAFTNSLRDAVGNVTLATTPTLVSRQRLNLDRVRVRGLEAHVAWSPQAAWKLEGGFVWSDARVQAAAVQPALVGRRLAQVPRLTATAAATWRPTAQWEVSAEARWSSVQFEDDENLLPLGAAGTIDVSVSRHFTPRVSAMLRADNLLDAAVETSRSVTAPTTYAAPRAVTLQVTVTW